MTEQEINTLIIESKIDTNLISDGYHTFGELYEHRMTLFQALCNTLANLNDSYPTVIDSNPWKSRLHSDGTMYNNMFIAGIGTEKGKTITYHIHNSYWDTFMINEIPNAPEWDGHTPQDVLRLLKNI